MDIIQNKYRITGILAKKLGFTSYEAVNIKTHDNLIIRKYDTPVSSNEFDEVTKQIQFLMESPIDKTAKIIDFTTDQKTGQLLVLTKRPSGRPLTSFFNKSWEKKKPHPFSSTTAFLDLAEKITELLKFVHKKDIPYLNLHPASIFIDGNDQVIALPPSFSTFSILKSGNQLRDSLPLDEYLYYLAPEQVGDDTQGLDFRTDFYLLGLLFYQCLTGTIPFTDLSDKQSFINALISKNPLNENHPEIFHPIMQIIEKLLSKSKESRYQSVYGLSYDIERCKEAYKNKTQLQSFTPGTRDISRNFSISKKIYGRETELSRLLISFYKAAKGYKENIFIKGEPGIGKTKLILEFKQNVTEAGGIVISGKFSKKERQKPYVAFKQAFSQFIRDIIARGEEATSILKESFRANLKYNSTILADLIPEIELLMGPLPDVLETSPIRNKNRFFTACRKFLESCLSFANPIVLFLDDLHWADPASLELFALISRYFQGGPLLVIGAYRNIDNISTRYISGMIDHMRSNYIPFEIIELESLATHQIAELIQDSFGNDAGENVSFANLIFQQTGGNPFQIHQYIFSMHASKLIFYNFESGVWKWDFDSIYRKSRQNFSQNYIREILSEFPDETINLLKTAACSGNNFSISKLAIVLDKEVQEIHHLLKPSVYSGFIFTTPIQKKPSEDILYFRHDTIQQTILESICENQKKEIHIKIGKKLYAYFKDTDNEILYEIVYHLNEGSDYLSKEEKHVIAELNVRAAKNAIQSSSGSTALNFLESATTLLGKNKWIEAPKLTTDIFLEAGYSALISGNYEKVSENAEKILLNNNDLLSQVKAYELLISSQISDNQLENAVKSGIFILEKLNIRLRKHPPKIKTFFAILKTKFNLSSMPEQKIKNLGPMNDIIMKTTMRILSLLLTPCYLIYPRLHPFICSLMVNLSLKYGYSPETSYGLSSFCIAITSVLKDYDYGIKIGKISLELAKKDKNSKSYGRTLIVNSIFIKHWKDPVNSCLPMLRKGKESALEIGDFEFGAYGMNTLPAYSLLAGHPLMNIKKELEISEDVLDQMGQRLAQNHIKIYTKVSKIFLKETELRPINTHDIFKKSKDPFIEDQNLDITSKFLINFMNTFIYLYMNNISKADRFWKKADKNLLGASSLVAYPYHLYMGSIISLLKYEKVRKNRYNQHLFEESLEREKRFKRFILKVPENHIHRYHLIKAEKARLSGNREKAEYFYQKAINEAREKDFTHDEAFAAERASFFYKEKNNNKTAHSYLNSAIAAYRKWGCILKLSSLVGTESDNRLNTTRYFTDTDFPLRSFPRIFRALRLLSEKVRENELILQLMDILIEISGATHGYFIDIKGNIPHVKASITADGGPEYYDPGASISSFQAILEPIVHNVFQTRQIFYPEQISREYSRYYTPDAEKVPKSVICIPVIRRHNLRGVIYLENLDVKNVFTQEKVEILTIIAAHTAIGLETADYFSNLTEKIGDTKQTENILQQTQLKLEHRIKQRTQDLIKLNTKLQEEIEFKVKAERALIQSETKYKTLVEKMNDGLGVQDKNGIITYVNERMCGIMGYKDTELIGRKALDVIKEITPSQSYKRLKEFQKDVVLEQLILRKDGKKLNVLFQGQNLYDNEGSYEGSFAVITDITPLKNMAIAVQQREEQIRALLNATDDSVIMIDSNGKILTANSSAAKRFGYSLSSFIGKQLLNLFPQEVLKDKQKYIQEITSTGKIIKFQDISGDYVFDITFYPVMNNRGEIDRIAVYAKDITELKKAEAKISNLTKEIIKAQENERRKIALDLHDHVAQNLSFLKITADSLKNIDDVDIEKKVNILSNGLKGSITDIRHISYDLRPPNLDELGLAKSIYQHCEEFSIKHQINVDFTSAGIENLKLDFDIEINLFRIIQEALTNVHKHSQATNVRIRLIASYPRIILRIEDNGKGFTYDENIESEVTGTQMGLKGMNERINLIGGKMEIKTNPDFGTKIVAEIPYPEIKQSDHIDKEIKTTI